uniref:Major capsid protein n=1 Tax=Vibrio phage Vc1 TaxID=1480731 RepID=A0A6M5CE06_9CAUD
MHRATHILIPPSMRKVLSVRMPETTESYLQYFQKQNAGITFEAVSELENYDGAGNKAVLVYEKIRNTVFDKVGLAQIIADYTDDLPTVDALMTSEFGKVFRLGNAFLISIDEIKAGARTGKSLSTRKANAAQLAHDQLVNKLVFKGSKPHKIPSVFEHPNITKIVSAKWMDGATKSRKPHRMNWRKQSRRLRLRLTGCTAQLTFHRATHILIPPSMRKVLSVRMPETTESYLQYFQKQNAGITFEAVSELENYDGAGNKAVLVYEKIRNMSIEIPEAFNMLPAQAKDLHFKIPCTSKCTGLTIYRPLTLVLITGVHRATHILIPPSMRKVLSVRMPETTESYLQYFQKQNAGITFEAVSELENYDGAGNKAVLVYEKIRNMSIEIPEAFNMLPAQAKDLHFKIPCTSKCTGLTIYRPLTLVLITGV